jgi:ADP-ribose pyrophosphatase YjhB (NUDIX family)
MKVYKGSAAKGEIEIQEERVVFENQYATLNNDQVRFPCGKTGEYLRFRWNAPYGVMVFAKDETGGLLLIRNFRHETRAWHWEIPKGFGKEDIEPIDCAKAELREETGYVGKNWALFREFNHAGHITYLYQCEVTHQTGTEKEHSEAIASSKLFTKEECRQMLMDDKQVTDPMTLFVMAYIQQAES